MTVTTPHDIPSVEKRCVCIATKEGVGLAAMISSYFDEPSTYFCVFEFPTLKFSYTGISSTDGYFQRILGDNASGQIGNALARIQPDKIILAGLSEVELSYLRARLPKVILERVSNVDEFLALMGSMSEGVGTISCRPSQLVEGLLAARFSEKRLRVDQDASELPRALMNGGNGILIIETDNDLHDLAAINYAAAFKLDVVLVPSLDREAIKELPHVLAKWSNDRSYFDFKRFERLALRHIRKVDFQKYTFAVFFTVGVPYGLFLKNMIPICHVLKRVDPGVFIAANLSDDMNPRALGSSLHFSPQFFPTEETEDVIRIFEESNFVTKALIGEDATARNLADYAGYYPYDVLHICSHGGEIPGYFVVQKFKDREGAEHSVEYYEVVQIDPEVTDGKVLVTRKIIYQRFDSYKWGSEPLMQLPSYIFDDMLSAFRADKETGVIRVPVTYPIAFSSHIRCHGGFHQGAFQTLSDLGRPFVFNNTCSSSHELAPIFIDAGARAYIGTLWDVGNLTATRAAKKFYTSAMRHGSLLRAFHEIASQPSRDKDANVYVFWGLHFSTLRKPPERSDESIYQALMHSFVLWTQKVATSEDPVIKRNGAPIVAFLYRQLLSHFTVERLQELIDFNRESVEEIVREHPDDPDNHLTRGFDEIVAPKSQAHVKPRKRS